MTSSYNYTFDSLSRIGDDVCGISERDMQNQNFGSYLTQNHWESECNMKKPINFATTQPNVYYNGGAGVVAPCYVDDHSDLTIGATQNRPKCRITLVERPYLTIPYLGKGPSKPVLESKLQQGSYSGDKKSCKNLTEKTLKINQELVPSLKSSIQNPANLCEGVAADGWIRGGLPSRELSRDKDYFSKCN